MVLAAAERRLDGLFELVHAIARGCGDSNFAAAARNFIRGDKIALVIALQNRRAGLCKLRNEPVNDRDMVFALRVGAVNDVDEKVGVLQLLERGAECVDQMVRQLGDEADGVGQDGLTRIGHSPLPCGGVERVEQAVVGRDIRARQAV